MEPENWESLENDFTKTFKRDKIFSDLFYLQDVPNNFENPFYNIDNGLNYFYKKHDSENALILNEDISPSVNNYNSSSNILIQENKKCLNNEAKSAHHKDNKNLIKNGNKKVEQKIYNFICSNSSKETKIRLNKSQFFKVINPQNDSLLIARNCKKDCLLQKKRLKKRHLWEEKKEAKQKRRKNRRDIMRRMIARKFLNAYIINELNAILKKVKSTIYFEKFEKDFSYDLAKKKNKKFLNKTLEEIFTTDELYRGNKLDKFHHNKQQIQELKSVENKNIIKEAKIDIILEKKIGGLFKEYLSSSNFKKDICDLGNKSKKYEEEYIEKYKQYAMNFIENSDE